MKLTAAELDYQRSQGLYITEMCDRRGNLLNQTVCCSTTSLEGGVKSLGRSEGQRRRTIPTF